MDVEILEVMLETLLDKYGGMIGGVDFHGLMLFDGG
jgi:hypothetical protein